MSIKNASPPAEGLSLPPDVWMAIRSHLTLPPHHINLSQVCSASRAAYDGDETWRRLCLEIGIGRPKGSAQSWKEIYVRVVAHKKVCRVTKCYKYGIPSMHEVGDLLTTPLMIQQHQATFTPPPPDAPEEEEDELYEDTFYHGSIPEAEGGEEETTPLPNGDDAGDGGEEDEGDVHGIFTFSGPVPFPFLPGFGHPGHAQPNDDALQGVAGLFDTPEAPSSPTGSSNENQHTSPSSAPSVANAQPTSSNSSPGVAPTAPAAGTTAQSPNGNVNPFSFMLPIFGMAPPTAAPTGQATNHATGPANGPTQTPPAAPAHPHPTATPLVGAQPIFGGLPPFWAANNHNGSTGGGQTPANATNPPQNQPPGAPNAQAPPSQGPPPNSIPIDLSLLQNTFASLFGIDPLRISACPLQNAQKDTLERTPDLFPLSSRNKQRVPIKPSVTRFLLTLGSVSFKCFLEGRFDDSKEYKSKKRSDRKDGDDAYADLEACWYDDEVDRDHRLEHLDNHPILQNVFACNPPVTSMLVTIQDLKFRIVNDDGITNQDVITHINAFLDKPLTDKEWKRSMNTLRVAEHREISRKKACSYKLRRDVVMLHYEGDCDCKYCGTFARASSCLKNATGVNFMIQPM